MIVPQIKGGQILITGGSGVVGSYVIDSLKEDFDIVSADLIKPVNDVKFVKVDLRKPFSLSSDFEICIDLAASVGGIQYFTKHPVNNLRDNPRMTANILDAVVNSKIQQIIYTSSSVLYEHATVYPTPEAATLTLPPPSSAYGLSKLVGENLCKAYNEEFGINYTLLRLFNVYGPREAPEPEYAHVIPELIRKVLSGHSPIEIYGTGEQTRTFTHGRDVGRAYSFCLKNKNAINQVFNVSGNQEMTIAQVLIKIWEMTGHDKEQLKIKHLPPLPHDIKRRFSSNSKIFEKLKWKPEILFDDGLAETIEWIRKLGYQK
jgi:nucleoside-diphosphate-sugar epimerase